MKNKKKKTDKDKNILFGIRDLSFKFYSPLKRGERMGIPERNLK